MLLKDVVDRSAPPSELDKLRLPTSQASRYALATGNGVVTARSSVLRAAVVRDEHSQVSVILGANLFALRILAPALSPTLIAAYLRLPAT